MKPDHDLRAQMDDEGRLVLSPEVASRYGIKPGVRLCADERTSGLYLRRPTRLLKLYIEPTNQCNLDCRTCIRHSWNEQLGKMSDSVFDRVIEGLSAFSAPPTVFFGGFGEPLFHPKIVEMLTRAKALGAPVELITNGTQLTRDLSRELIAAGIDILWVSIDGATPESYADIRLGAALPQVLENVAHFRDALYTQFVVTACGVAPSFRTLLGIAFVAMKRNIADLPAVLSLAQSFGAKRFFVTNVLPYTKEMCDEVLYNRGLYDNACPEPIPRLSMPRIDVMESTRDPLYWSMRYGKNMTWAGSNLASANGRCPFIESGAGAIGWDGSFSPCLPLLHSHISFVLDRERFSRRWIVGNVAEKSLPNLWNAPEHIAFREHVQTFDFAPCASCGGCDISDSNEEDCWGNGFPTCGGCLWAQGMIQCP
jgi:MoaA/NifB/PqqE/SkfB family radical SAM enzyme